MSEQESTQETQFTDQESLLATEARGYGTTTNVGQSDDLPTPKPVRVVALDLYRGLLMMLQAIDHCALFVGAWRHGVAIESESDGQNVSVWNSAVPWTARMFTHLCAPGFTFLLGMGIVYFGRSRSKLGWTTRQFISHFAVRAVVLVLVNEVFITLIAGRGKLWLLNIVLVELAVNYFLAGLLWLALDAIEKRNQHSSTQHLGNAFLAVMTVVTIGWNHWLSPFHGSCLNSPTTFKSQFLNFWFYPTMTAQIASPFPPLAWTSFAIFGVLYARMLPKQYTRIIFFNLVLALLLASFFVHTRILNVGNLTEHCLHMPEHEHLNGRNQYLRSFRSFLYIAKYPPSAAFFAFTMSMTMLILTLLHVSQSYAVHIPGLLVFGNSALFFYVIHLVLYNLLGELAKMWFGHDLGYWDNWRNREAFGVGNGIIMWVVYLIGLAILYPLCKWWAGFKAKKGVDSIWRFF